MSLAGICLPVALVLIPRGIQAPALAVPLASLPGPHVLAPISQPALPCTSGTSVSPQTSRQGCKAEANCDDTGDTLPTARPHYPTDVGLAFPSTSSVLAHMHGRTA